MMDDMLRPKHHINPQAQCDSPKDAAAVSLQEQAQGKRRVVYEEEDTAVRSRGSRTGWFSFRIWRGEMSGGRTDQRSEKSMRGEALERVERLESKGRTDLQQSCWRENTGIKKGFIGRGSRDKLSVHRENTQNSINQVFRILDVLSIYFPTV